EADDAKGHGMRSWMKRRHGRRAGRRLLAGFGHGVAPSFRVVEAAAKGRRRGRRRATSAVRLAFREPDCPALLGGRARRGNSLRSFVATLKQSRRVRWTKRAARAALPPALLGASHARRRPRR